MTLPALVQQAVGTYPGSGTTITVTLGSAPTAGNDLLLGFEAANTPAIVSVASTNAIWGIRAGSHTNRAVELWEALNVGASAGTIVTITFASALAGSAGANVSEWSGLAKTSAADQTNTNSGNSTAIATNSITPAQGVAQVLISVCRSGGTVSGGPSAGWTALTSPDASSRGFLAYQIVSSTNGSYSNAYTQATSTWEALIASYKAANFARPWLFH